MTSATADYSHTPVVSIGLPVFNGANFLSDAIESILAQDFQDFELIIADNASTDDTPKICQHYAALDPRVRVIRHPRNIGAAKNYNYVVNCASGEFFKWAAHDDVLGPQFLSTCLKGFEQHGEAAVLVYPNFNLVDADMTPIAANNTFVHTTAACPATRLQETLSGLGVVTSVFGVYRRKALMKTRLIGSFISSDFALLVESALLGHVVRLGGDVQFSRRLHDGTSRAHKTSSQILEWFDPDAVLDGDPNRRLKWEYLRSVLAIPGLSRRQRFKAFLFVLRRIMVEKLRRRKRQIRGVLSGVARKHSEARIEGSRRT